MIQINAEKRGRFVKNGLFSLEVLSLHKGIINLLDRESGYVISLIEDIRHMTGMSLLVPQLFPDYTETINPGNIIHLKDQGISYSKSKEWTGFLTDSPISADKVLKMTSIAVKNLESGDSFISLLTGQNITVFQKKAEMVLKNIVCINKKIKGLENLIGLGQGLTPSGDDFITGVLLACFCADKSYDIDRTAVEKYLTKTTYAGRTLLYLALNRSFPAYLLTFQKEISEAAEEKEIIRAILKASRHGASSGQDSLAGFFWFYHFADRLNTFR